LKHDAVFSDVTGVKSLLLDPSFSTPCNMVIQIPILHFSAWNLVLHLPVLHFPVLHFQSTWSFGENFVKISPRDPEKFDLKDY